MRSLRTLPRRRPGGHGRRPQALRRHRAAALIAAVCAIGTGGAIAQGKPEPPRPPKPKLTLLTKSEEAALANDAIRVEVAAKKAKKVTVKANFVVDGYPEDYAFRLGPQRKGIASGTAKVTFPLSPRQHEVLDFAAKTCRGASLAITAKTGQRTGKLQADLKLPGDC